MDSQRAVILAAALAGTMVLGGCMSDVRTAARTEDPGAAADRRQLADVTVAEWSNVSALAAESLLDQYGVPDEVHSDHLVWNGNGPWRRTVVRDVRPSFEDEENADLGVIEQTIGAALTPKQAVDVAAFDDRVAYDPRAGELTARSDRQEVNFLRLNLAQDVAGGRMSPEQARGSYESILSFEASGKVSPYLRGLNEPAP